MPDATAEVAPPPSNELTEPRARRAPGWRLELLAVAIVGVVIALPLRGLLRAPGPPMEEGFMLVFPERVLHGAIPNRDFLHLYGPGSLWALAAAFKAFGVSLWTERVFGLLQQLAIVAGVYLIARQWNRTLAVGGAVVSTLIIVPFGLSALAWVGAVGLGLLGVAAALQARYDRNDRAAYRWAVTAGLLFAASLLFRPDLVIAVTLSLLVIARRMDRSRRTRLLGAGAAGLSLYLVHIVMAGPGHVWKGMVLDPVFNLRGGRSLPMPPPWSRLDGFLQRAGNLQQLSWPLPAPRTSQQLFLWFFLLIAVVAFLCFMGWHAVRTEPGKRRSVTLLAIATFSAGMMPQALQRVDSAHFAWVSCVPFAFLPLAVYELIRWQEPKVRAGWAAAASSVATILILAFFIPAFTLTRYTDYLLQTFNTHRHSYEISYRGRTFYYGKEDRAAAAKMVINEAARISKPGQRLFVGPVNLRKTPYSDAYLYYMLPQLKPGTYYIEMDPMDTKPDSGLDQQLAHSDIAILSKIWDNWSEPNDSRKIGSPKTQQVLADHFCEVGSYLDLYWLYEKCR